jgi:AcrR family transcriptional regulator
MEQNIEQQVIVQQQIKESACKLFKEKGYGAVCLNDIAKDAKIDGWDIGLYFNSKEHLFDVVIKDEVNKLFENLETVFNDENTSLSQKVQLIIQCYFSFFAENENLSLFIFREIKVEFEKSLEKKYHKQLMECVFTKQIQQHLKELNLDYYVSVADLLLDLSSLCVFPLIISPSTANNDNLEYTFSFERQQEERKNLIFGWFKTLLML